eukprot:TRINITY_DN16500_c0_g1_i7.p1 TRINITY_DN16500_c0_g1~~TRINITY_DN16500_c0_g1_i7.p1  ORF type:complete len:353 (+),score=40.71 TRINITY_DN16500_c0_g1_i7:53-1060(+)
MSNVLDTGWLVFTFCLVLHVRQDGCEAATLGVKHQERKALMRRSEGVFTSREDGRGNRRRRRRTKGKASTADEEVSKAEQERREAEKDRASTANEVKASTGNNDGMGTRCLGSWVPWGGACYRLSTQRKSFDAAEAVCKRNGGFLASFHGEAEYDFLVSLCQGGPDHCWLGGRKNSSWTWTDGSEWRDARRDAMWEDNFPSEKRCNSVFKEKYKCFDNEEQHCFMLHFTTQKTRDTWCSREHSSVCRRALWNVIDERGICEDSMFIKYRYSATITRPCQSLNHTLQGCEACCKADGDCKAADYFRATGVCTRFSMPCLMHDTTPSRDDGKAYRLG